jgi:SAM-dependent methyltransferase
MERNPSISVIYNFPELYELLFTPYESQIRWLDKMLATYFPNGVSAFFEPACGAGFWLDYIKAEYSVGVDINYEMVSWCEKRFSRLNSINIRHGDMRLLPKDLIGKFDLALNLESTIGHLATIEELMAHMKSLRVSLKNEGFYFLGCPLKNILIDKLEATEEYNTEYKTLCSFKAKLKIWSDQISDIKSRTHYIVQVEGEPKYPSEIEGDFDINQYDSIDIVELISDSGFELISATYMDMPDTPESPNLYNLGLTSLVLKAV